MRGLCCGLQTRLGVGVGVLLLLVSGCNHTPTADYSSSEANGPRTAGADVLLTYNVQENHSPAWSSDGKGILYTFVDPSQPAHWCMGVLPPAGGTRVWEYCEHRAAYQDTLVSYPAYALGPGGLLYQQVTSSSRVPPTVIIAPALAQSGLWLGDTGVMTAPAKGAAPVELLAFPVQLPGVTITALEDLQWTGPNTFVAAAMQEVDVLHCSPCPVLPRDTLFFPAAVVTGSISGGHATLTLVPGTQGAMSLALMDGGTAIVYTRRSDPHLYRVVLAGGTPSVLATVDTLHIIPLQVNPLNGAVTPPDTTTQLLGVACSQTQCVVPRADIFAWSGGNPIGLVGQSVGPVDGTPRPDLRYVNLATGAVRVAPIPSIAWLPRRSPASGDVVLQYGGWMGNFGSWSGPPTGTLHLLQNFLP